MTEPSRATAVLQARDVSVAFGEVSAIDSVDLSLHSGEIVVIEGKSGSGKSTLLRALAGLEPLKSGQLVLDGAPSSGLTPAGYRAAVGFIPQQPVMFDLTVAENLQAGPGLRGKRLAESAVTDLLEQVGLSTAFAERSARNLSGGEKQRVAIARALANAPKVVLFDEPTSALDPVAATAILDLVRATAGRGRAVVVVTHIREHAARLGGTRYECRDGKLRPPA